MLYPLWREIGTTKLDMIWSLNLSQGLNIKTMMQYSLHKKLRFSIKGFYSKWEQICRKLKFTFTKENVSGKFHFLCKDCCIYPTFKIMLTRYNLLFTILHCGRVVPIKLFNNIYLPDDMPKQNFGCYFHSGKINFQLQSYFG